MFRFIRVQLKRFFFIFPRVIGWYARTFWIMMGSGRVKRTDEYWEAFHEDVQRRWAHIKEHDEGIKSEH